MRRPSRREFVAVSLSAPAASGISVAARPVSVDAAGLAGPAKVDLAPARWIWLAGSRCLPNTFVLFRRILNLDAPPVSARAWITADSRYRLTVNGAPVQWGPAPCDPRELDVDPVDLKPYLRAGDNVIGVEVLYYGYGEGTWPAGMPGLLFHAVVEGADGSATRLVSDDSWMCRLDRAHRPGMYKRWFLRALQEEFDARLHPQGWDTAAFSLTPEWTAAVPLDCPADKPASCQRAHMWAGDSIDRADPAKSSLRLRQIPACMEQNVPAARMVESGRVEWLRDPADWFESRMPGCFRLHRGPAAGELPATPLPSQGAYAIFEWKEQMVGWPYFTIDAPAGTVVELMTQESHDPARTGWLDTHHFSWSRWICREGVNRFQAFDYESLRWMQLHVRGAARPVRIVDAGVRRRQFAWPVPPHIRCADPALQRLFDASVNTLRNSAIETIVDGMGRERQQYSGDGAHQLHAIRYAFGETRICRRYLRTFSEGLTPGGYFMDCWPAYDRLARVAQKHMDGAYWGPLLDHGVGFLFDCWNHYFETGEKEAIEEPYPRLLRFAAYLESLLDAAALLPVENLGIPTVWMDHIAFRQVRHRQCAFNLYAAAALEHALAPLAELFGEADRARHFRDLGKRIQAGAVRRYWSRERGLFVDNLPWAGEEGAIRLSDRTLATAILFDQCPGTTGASVRALTECPPELGISYPCNAGWRYWALAKAGRAEVVIGELRARWASMPSVLLNNTLQEDWTAPADSGAQWSHCAQAPLFVLFMDIAGIRPIEPGFRRCRIRPQLGDLPDLELTAHTVRGPIEFQARRERGGHRVSVSLPSGCEAEIVSPDSARPMRVAAGSLATAFIPSAPAGRTSRSVALHPARPRLKAQ
jgi:alpha-L-rhamnosidase